MARSSSSVAGGAVVHAERERGHEERGWMEVWCPDRAGNRRHGRLALCGERLPVLMKLGTSCPGRQPLPAEGERVPRCFGRAHLVHPREAAGFFRFRGFSARFARGASGRVRATSEDARHRPPAQRRRRSLGCGRCRPPPEAPRSPARLAGMDGSLLFPRHSGRSLTMTGGGWTKAPRSRCTGTASPAGAEECRKCDFG
jgi:hypothetical protein